MENQTVQSPTPEPILAPVQISEPKAKFPVMYLVLSLLILTLLASTAFLYYQNMQLKNMLTSYQNSASPTPTAYQSPIPTTDLTTNWKTYKSTAFNFSFKYPTELTYIYDQSDQYVEDGISNAMILIQNFDGSKPRTEIDNDFQMVAYIANKSGQFNLEDPQGEQTKTTINGVGVIKSFTIQKWVLVPTVFFQSTPNKVAFQLSNPKSTNKAWFDQIVSTFQVTN